MTIVKISTGKDTEKYAEWVFVKKHHSLKTRQRLDDMLCELCRVSKLWLTTDLYCSCVTQKPWCRGGTHWHITLTPLPTNSSETSSPSKLSRWAQSRKINILLLAQVIVRKLCFLICRLKERSFPNTYLKILIVFLLSRSKQCSFFQLNKNFHS